MNKALILILAFILASCAGSQRTKYQSYQKKKGGGYTEERFEDKLQLISFRANSYTKRSYAELFAKFRAVELCLEVGKKYAEMVGVLDRSESRTITRSNSNVYGFPSYYYGHSPFYNRYSGIGFSAGFNTMSMNYWDETLVYPQVDVLYRCSDEVLGPEVILREVPADEMKHLVKDLKGALQVEKILEVSPNKKLEIGDVLLRAGGKRIEKNYQLLQLFGPGSNNVPVEFLREGERRRLNMTDISVTKQVDESQQELIKEACKFKEIKMRALCK